MDYDEIQIGKVTKYNDLTQLGEIVSKMGAFMFLKSDLILEEDEEIQVNDIVRFRGELVQDTNRAFFIKKVSPNYKYDNTQYVKIYKGLNEGNDN